MESLYIISIHNVVHTHAVNLDVIFFSALSQLGLLSNVGLCAMTECVLLNRQQVTEQSVYTST